MSDYPVIHANGENRVLSLHPREMPVGDPRCCHGVCGVEGGPKIIERKDWAPAIDLSNAFESIHNQGQLSLCHSACGAGATETAFHLVGLEGLRMSMGSLAYRVTGGVNEGAGLDQVAEALLKYGVAEQSVIPDDDYSGRGYPKGWADNALKHKCDKLWDCGHDTVIDALGSGLNRGWIGGLGCNSFGGGHAIRICGYWKRKNGVYQWFGMNSWGDWTNWTKDLLGEFKSVLVLPPGVKSNILDTDGNGYWTFSERALSAGLNMYGGWCYQAPTPAPMPAPVVS